MLNNISSSINKAKESQEQDILDLVDLMMNFDRDENEGASKNMNKLYERLHDLEGLLKNTLTELKGISAKSSVDKT